MIGWYISIYRQTDEGASPAPAESPTGKRLVVWQTRGFGGLDWIDELVQKGKAIDLGGDGYPRRYTATAEHLIPGFIDGPQGAQDTLECEESDILTEKREGKMVIDRVATAACRPDEWLMVEAWDKS